MICAKRSVKQVGHQVHRRLGGQLWLWQTAVGPRNRWAAAQNAVSLALEHGKTVADAQPSRQCRPLQPHNDGGSALRPQAGMAIKRAPTTFPGHHTACSVRCSNSDAPLHVSAGGVPKLLNFLPPKLSDIFPPHLLLFFPHPPNVSTHRGSNREQWPFKSSGCQTMRSIAFFPKPSLDSPQRTALRTELLRR